MDVIIPLAILTVLLGLASTRAVRRLRGPRTDQPGDESGVTLSVLPGRRAVVTIDAEPERSPGAAQLLDQAVRDAFTFDGVDGVEVRGADGEFLELRLRPSPATTRHDRDCSTLDAGP
jgi:hypothetical protein